MRAGWAAIVAWCEEREPADALAAFRIAVGLTTLHVWGAMLWTGAWALYVPEHAGGLAGDAFGPAWWRALPAPEHRALGLLVACALASAALTLGVGGRWTALALGQLAIGVFSLHPGTGGGHDRLITNACWLLFLSGAHTSWSVPVRWRTGRWRGTSTIAAWPRRLAVLQLVVMYTVTGLAKQGASWFAAGRWRAVHDAMLMPPWAREDWTAVAHVFPLTQLATRVVWWWEVAWCLVLPWAWLRRPRFARTRAGAIAGRVDLRVPLVILGVVTHGALWWTLELGPFSAMSLAFYLCLLTPADLGRAGGAGATSSLSPPAL